MTPSAIAHQKDFRNALLLFLAYLAFVIYGSLVPLEYRAHTWDLALQKFANIPWYNLGATKRADWAANAVLYVPLAFLMCTLLAAPRKHAATRAVAALLSLVLCSLIAVGVEFTQISFYPRTVSLNDLVAEIIGSAIGIGVWLFWRPQLTRLWRDFKTGGRRSLTAALIGFGIAYLGLTFFPFDFVLSLQELGDRLAQNNSVGLILANWQDSPLRILLRLGGESIAIAPLGILLGLLANHISLRRTLLLGVVLGMVLECMQLLLVSGTSQGISLLTRGLGLAFGAWLGQQLQHHGVQPLARLVQRLSWPAWPFYLAALLGVSGWFHTGVRSIGGALQQIERIQWMPFYFHYYTSEPVAMASLLANLAMYAPLGVLAWARHVLVPRRQRKGALQPALWGGGLALLIEASKLWLKGEHPDPTNIFIGATGAAMAYLISTWIGRVCQAHDEPTATLSEPPKESGDPEKPQAKPAPVRHRFPAPPAWAVGIALGTALLMLIGLVAHPYRIILLPGLALAAWLLWQRPWLSLGLLAATLPILDLAPLSGRLVLDEFDLLVLLSLAVAYSRFGGNGLQTRPPTWMKWLYIGLWLSTLLALRPILELLGSGAGAGFGTGLGVDASHSPVDAWLVGKGLVWFLALAPLLLFLKDEQKDRVMNGLVYGFAAGLVLLTISVLWERQVYVGLLDFSNNFRVTGTISALFSGGAYIETYIALAFPSLLLVSLQQKSHLLKLFGLGVCALAAYAMLVTYSRAGYVGLGVAILLSAFLYAHGRFGRKALWAIPAIAILGAIASMPFLSAQFAQDRLARSQQDMQTRLGHWANALGMLDASSTLVGRGFSQYPNYYLWDTAASNPPGTFSVLAQEQTAYLKLGGGEPYYLDQIIGFAASKPFEVTARVRFHDGATRLTVSVCEKALLYSYQCASHALVKPKDQPFGTWLTLKARQDKPAWQGTSGWPGRTVKFSIWGPKTGSIDVTGISLLQGKQNNLLQNPGFEQGLKHWMPAIDFDLPWHIHQGFLDVLFAQGLLGLLLLGGLAWAGLRIGLRQSLAGETNAIALFAGISAFITISLLGSNLDNAKMLLVFSLTLSLLAIFRSKRPH